MTDTNTQPETKIVNEQTGKPTDQVLPFSAAYTMFKDLVKDNRQRNAKNARIAKKINGEQPFPANKMKASNQGWRNNRPTGFINSILVRLQPPYKQMVDQLPLLTYSHFPGVSAAEVQGKQDKFRQRITDGCRSWNGWNDFVNQVVNEDIVYGYAAVGWKDEYSFKPRMYRSDEAMFYVGCSQDASRVEYWGLKQDLMVPDMLKLLQDPMTAANAGWKVLNLAKKLNVAPREFDDYSQEENLRVYEDLIRENSVASTFTSTVKVIKAGNIYHVGKDGLINHYVFDRDDGTPLMFRRGRYDSMPQCVALFSAEIGDRTLHGSRGAGRALFNTHVTVEQARNLIYDALFLSGMMVLKKVKKEPGAGNDENVALRVNHPFVIVGDGFEVLEKVAFTVNSEAFFALDRHATSTAEILVGAFMPGQTIDEQGSTKTASEVNYVASIDAQIKAGILARFADQFFTMMDQIQVRICCPEVIEVAKQVFEIEKKGVQVIHDKVFFERLEKTESTEGFEYVELPPFIDADAVEIVKNMLADDLSVKDILILANSTSRANVEDAIASQSGVLDLIVSQYAGNSMIDAVELTRRHLSSKVGASATERLMNVDLNPLTPLKQGRQQMNELSDMVLVGDVPVDPSDDDATHLRVIVDRLKPMLNTPSTATLTMTKDFVSRVRTHAIAHATALTEKGGKVEEIEGFEEIMAGLDKIAAQTPIDQQAAEAIAPAIQPGASVAPTAESIPAEPVTPVAETVSEVASPPRPTPPTGG